MNTDFLKQVVLEAISKNQQSLIRDVLQARKDEFVFKAYEHKGCFYRVNSLEAYYKANLALLDTKIRNNIFSAEAPIYTKVGDNPSFMELFKGDADKIRAVDASIAKEMGFAPEAVIPVSGQTYSRLIFLTASEANPFAKSGGLADVAGALPKALVKDGVDARVIMPLYGDLKYRDKLEYVTNYSVPVGWRSQYCGLFKADVDGVTYYFLDNEYYFKRRGLYGFYDDGERFAFFSRAVLEIILSTFIMKKNISFFFSQDGDTIRSS